MIDYRVTTLFQRFIVYINQPCLIFRVCDAVPLASGAPSLADVPDGAAPRVAELVVQVQRRRQKVVPNGHLREDMP